MVIGARMKIESDQVEITSGGPSWLDHRRSITLNVTNLDHQKWLEIMNVTGREKKNLRKIASHDLVVPIWRRDQIPFR